MLCHIVYTIGIVDDVRIFKVILEIPVSTLKRKTYTSFYRTNHVVVIDNEANPGLSPFPLADSMAGLDWMEKKGKE